MLWGSGCKVLAHPNPHMWGFPLPALWLHPDVGAAVPELAPWLQEVGIRGKKPQIFPAVVFEGRLTPPGGVIWQSYTPGVLQGPRGPSPVRMVGVPLPGSPGEPQGSGAEQLFHALNLQEAGAQNDKREEKQPKTLLSIPFFAPGVAAVMREGDGARRRNPGTQRHPWAPRASHSPG